MTEITPKRLRALSECELVTQDGHTRWENTGDMREALELAADEIERLQAALAAAPVREEREGACWCNGSPTWRWVPWAPGITRWCHYGGDCLDGPFCCGCGAELCTDGIARRWRERGAA